MLFKNYKKGTQKIEDQAIERRRTIFDKTPFAEGSLQHLVEPAEASWLGGVSRKQRQAVAITYRSRSWWL